MVDLDYYLDSVSSILLPDISKFLWVPDQHPRGFHGEFADSVNDDIRTSFHQSQRPGEMMGDGVSDAIDHPNPGIEEKGAVRQWTNKDSKMMNLSISTGDDRYANMASRARNLHNLISRSTVTKPILLQRNVDGDTARIVFGDVGSMVGKKFTDKRFIATTKDDQPLTRFGPVYMRYHVTPGSHALDVYSGKFGGGHPEESEVILQDHQQYHVVRDAIDPTIKARVIELETVT